MTMLMRRLGSILGIKMIMKQMVSSTICVTILVIAMLSITKISDLGVMLWKSLLSVVLGSGKTSAISHLIADALENNLNPAVIINEFGKRSVDGQLIERPEVPMSEITEGCICCAMKSDVSQQLHELYLKYQPDIIFIECSGVAEPLAVVDACFTPVLAPFITLRSMVGIIDASMYSRIKSYTQDIAALFYEQLRHCSTLFVNKIDKIEWKKPPACYVNSSTSIAMPIFKLVNLEN